MPPGGRNIPKNDTLNAALEFHSVREFVRARAHQFSGGEMFKKLFFTSVIALASLAMAGQSGKPDTSAPTKVTGEPKKTPGGVSYWDIKEGPGAVAVKGMTVTVHYTGWLTNGKKFDSSVDGGQPISFKLDNGSVIDGWVEGVAGMKIGGKRQLKIPPAMGYGHPGHPPQIPPDSTLIFDVELLGVSK
jgi:FKBP-type peptidyl-prolyl cis-trans isomerase